jgi:hypothetical protein
MLDPEALNTGTNMSPLVSRNSCFMVAGWGTAGCSGGASSPEVVEGHRQYRRKAALRHQLTQRGPVPSVWNFLNQQLIIQVTNPALPCNLWAHRWHSVFEVILAASGLRTDCCY